MTLKVGDEIPNTTLYRYGDNGIETISSHEAMGKGRVVVFAVPAAFSPTCSDDHLPSYLVHGPEILARGVDRIVCLAVNDPYVMSAWSKNRGVGHQLVMLSDGNGEFARAAGMERDLSAGALGSRSARYAAILQDGVVEHLGLEPGKGVTVSGAEAILKVLG